MWNISRRTAISAVLLGFLVCQATAAPSNKTKVVPAAALSDESTAVNKDDVETKDLCKSKDSEIDCNQTEYSAYMECIEAKRSIRRKRQTMCSGLPNPISETIAVQDPVALTQCEFNIKMCIAGCQNDTLCESGCPTTCDSAVAPVSCLGAYNSCVSDCLPGQPCETKCKTLCPDGTVAATDSGRPLGYKTVIFEGHNGGPAERVQVPIGIGHNITTIIKLNNYINNTNEINVPTTLNNTNLNTIHLYMNTSSISTDGGRFGLGETKEGSCCFAVQPKSCRTSTSGLRCRHRRHKTCGEQCTSRIIHVQNKKRCHRGAGRRCSSSTSYVAEPNPKCHYQGQWPYVNCGGPPAAGQRNCEGCYDHYSANSYYDVQIPQRCMSCYDGGYDMGPRYRHGPFYRPNYYHQPPCYVTGTCYNAPVPQFDYGYYAPPPPPMYYPPPPPSYYPAPSRPIRPLPDGSVIEEGPKEELYPGEDEYSGYEPVDESSFKEEDWETVVQKCKVINVDDSTVIIKNCTASDLDANPYAANQEVGGEVEEVEAQDTPREYMAMEPMAAPYYGYNPYGYNYPPPPPPGPVYYAQPYPQYYQEQPQQVRHSRQSKSGVIRPSYYDNYGEDDGAESTEKLQEEDDFWAHDEDELEKNGFQRAV